MKKILTSSIILLLCHVSLFSQNYKFGKVSKEELQEQFHPLDSTAEAAYLYRNRRTYFSYIQGSGFQLVNEIHERIKIYTKDGFEKANIAIGYYDPERGDAESVTGIKGYTFSLENGKIKKEKLSKKGIFKEKKNKFFSIKKIAMPSVKEGVVLELKYKLISPYATSIDDLHFQFGIPVKKLEYQIEVPEFFIFNKRSRGYYSPKISSKSKSGTLGAGGRNYTVNVTKFNDINVPALRNDEPFVTSLRNYRGSMQFELTQENFISLGGDIKSYSNTWEQVSKQIYKSPSFGTELKKSNYYKDALATLIGPEASPFQKVASIFQFVKSRVKWNGFVGIYTDNGVKKAFKEREGNAADINLMLTAMLRSAGLNANPVLVSTRDNGVPLFPTIKGFNSVITIVEFANGSYILLDATEKYSLPNILPVRNLNWNGRVVAKDGSSSWVKLTSSKPALEENFVMCTITEDLQLEGLMRTKYDNLNAFSFRKNNNHVKEDGLIEKLEEKNNIEIEDFKIVNKEKIDKAVVRNIKFSSEDLVEQINGKIYIEPLLFLSQHTNPFKLEDRKFPVDFATPWKDKNTVSIKIPEGYKVEKLPESLAIGLPENLGVFKFQTKEVAGKISTVCVLQFNSAIIAPQYYAALKDFYRQMVKKESEKIVLVKI